MEDYEELKRQITVLQEELENSQSKNDQAAQYGLQVLEEKMLLQQEKEELESKIEDLQAQLENSRHEFDLSKKALQNTQSKTKKAFSEGENREIDLDKKRRDAEERLALVEQEKEMEVYQLQTMLKSSNSEIERLAQLSNDISLNNQTLEHQRLCLKKELKDMKIHQAHLDATYSELEEENCVLQKQVSTLTKSQAEYEGCKHELQRISEEFEYVSRELDETIRLKELFERQVDEVHDTLQKEREIKLQLKRELAQYDNIDLTGINLHNQFLDENVNQSNKDENDQIELEHPLIRHITSDLIHNGGRNGNENGNDLYSELNFSEISKLKQQLCVAEKEKVLLINNLREQQVLMENKNRENNEKSEKEDHETLTKFNELREELEHVKEKDREKKENIKKLDTALKEAIEYKRNLQNEVDRLTATVNQRNIESQTSNEMMHLVSDRISQLYHRLCMSNGDVPRQIVLENAKNEARNIIQEDEQQQQQQHFDDNDVVNNIDENDDLLTTTEVAEDHGILTAMLKQMECLETEVDQLVTMKDSSNISWTENLENQQETQEQMRALEEEVLRLKSLLSSKREQIATLRTVLKANKHTAEIAISNLKQKYHQEKTCISDTMVKLRGELKALKEDAITFARLRMVFAARSDEYVAQLDAMQRQLQSAEDEKRTLNTLLRKTITQKLAITQRLEDLQFEIEQQKRAGSSPNKQQQQDVGGSAKKKTTSLLSTKFRS